MNKRMVAYVIGVILTIEALTMVPMIIVSLIYGESILPFLYSMMIMLLFGVPLVIIKPRNNAIYARDGFVSVALAWIVMSVAGALPFYFCGGFKSFWDCLFEVVSGFTTTGSSVLTEPQALPYGILFWRSFTHWIGGMGVLVFVMAVLPLSSEHSMHLMRAEVPGPIVGKLVPKMRNTAKILYGVYTVMTAVLVLLLLLGGMPIFDSLCYAFGTAGTGGFSINSAGISLYNSAYLEIVISIFMLLFGINFNLYYFVLIGNVRDAIRSEELRWYLCIVTGSTLLIAVNTLHLFANFGVSLRYSLFQVSSIITTTGYATYDFNLFPAFSQNILLLLMVTGACAGSTGGGFKISRVIIILKCISNQVHKLIHPRAVSTVKLEGKSIDSKLIKNTLSYLAVYFVIICVSVLLLSIDGYDFTTTFSAELACFNNIGPGLGMVGPMGSFAGFSAFSKMLLALNMLFGRLEIFPMLVLFSPQVWRKNIA